VRRQRQEFQAPLAVDPLSACIMNIIRLKFWPAWPLPLPWVAPIGAIAERLDPLLDELRRQLLEGPSA
jgi:hypothetical protein